MNYTLRFLPEIEEDLLYGYSWYEEKLKGLGGEFLRVFYSCAGEIQRNPLLFQKVYGSYRRCLLRRFPYCMYFRVEEDQIIVTGNFHCARSPRTIRFELENRNEQNDSE
jgi:hypothetical protein